MNRDSLFSDKDKIQFFDVLRKMNEHLHLIRQYDKVEDIGKHFDNSKGHLINLKNATDDIVKSLEDAGLFKETKANGKNKSLDKKQIVRLILKGLREVADEGILYDEIINNLDDDKILDNENRKDLENKLKEFREHRKKIVNEHGFIFQKLKDIQFERSRYLELAKTKVEKRNSVYSNSKYKIRKSFRVIFNDINEKLNLAKDLKRKSGKLEKEVAKKNNLYEFQKLLFSEVQKIRQSLYDVITERNKCRPVKRDYSAFKNELQKERSQSVLSYDKHSWIIINQKLEEISKTNQVITLLSDRKESNVFLNSIFDQYNLGLSKLADNRIENFHNRDFNFIWLSLELIFQKVNVKTADLKIQRRIFQIFLGLDSGVFKKLLSDLKDSVKDIFPNLNYISDHKIFDLLSKMEIKDSFSEEKKNEQDEKRGDSKSDNLINRMLLDFVNKTHVKLENLQIETIIKVLENTIFEFLLNNIDDSKRGDKKVEKLEKNIYKYLERNISINSETILDDNTLFFKKSTSVLSEISEIEIFKKFYIVDGTNDKFLNNLKSKLKFLKSEIEFFLYSSRDHIKSFNDKILAEIPHEYNPFEIDNIVFKQKLSKESFYFSSKFRHIIKLFDRYAEKDFVDSLIVSDNEMAKKTIVSLKDRVKSRLRHLRIKQYDVLDLFLDSTEFMNITDRLQIYGGAFGIWDQEARELIRLQDRRYCRMEYRPDKEVKWYDISERYFKDGEWQSNPYEESIDLMFLVERNQMVTPEFYQNFSQVDNVLNEIEKANQFQFTEDGEISAYVLIYRMLNCMVKTKVEKGEQSCVCLGKSEMHEKFWDYYDTTNSEEEGTFLFNILSKPLSKLVKSEKLIKEKKDTEDISLINLRKNEIIDLIKHILQNQNFDLGFFPKELSKDVDRYAYEPNEAIARKEKFYVETSELIDKQKLTFLDEFQIQGLLVKTDSDESMLGFKSRIKITERYVNLCRFIIRELNSDNVKLKVACNYSEEYIDPINEEKYFIDKKLDNTKLEKLITNKVVRNQYLKDRKSYIDKVRGSIIDIAEKGRPNDYIDVSKFNKQISLILSLLLESVHLLLDNVTNSIDNNAQYQQSNKSSEEIWQLIKKELDKMSSFPLSQYFYWRANTNYAFSSLVLPMAATCTKKDAPNVGFLVLGLRNIIRDEKSNTVHLTHKNQNLLKEYIYTVKTLFQPLIHPYMDKIYYDSILNNSVKRSALTASVAQVMTRNMSHNIGSHVLVRLVRDLKAGKIGDLIIKDIGAVEQNYMPDFLSFIRTRMDFLSDISSGGASVGTPLNLESEIGYIYQKGDENKFGPYYNYIILYYISGIVNINVKDICIKFARKSENRNPILVSIPSGIMGAQAFHLIIENLLRNICKYEYKPGYKIEVNVEINSYKAKHNLTKISIASKVKDENGEYIDLTDSQLKIENIIEEKLIDESSKKINMKYLGYAEIKIACAYLRMIDLLEIESFEKYSKDAPLFNLKKMNKNEIRHEFYLNTVKLLEIRLTEESFEEINNRKLEELKNSGVLIHHSHDRKMYSEYDLLVTDYDLESKYNSLMRHLKVESVDKLVEILNKNEIIDILELVNDISVLYWKEWMMCFINFNDCQISLDGISIFLIENKSNPDNKDSAFVIQNIFGEKNSTQKISIENLLKNSDNKIIFDDHNGRESKLYPTHQDKIIYYDGFQNYSAFGNWLLNSIDSNGNKFMPKEYFELIESSLTRIVILDERIQDHFARLDKEERFKDIWRLEQSKVFIPSKDDINKQLQGSRFKEAIGNKYPINLSTDFKVAENFKNFLREANPEFLIIHITILEKNNITLQDFCEICNEILKKNETAPQKKFALFITTGRGAIYNIDYPYIIPFESLKKNIIEFYSKFNTVKELFKISNSVEK